MANLIYNKQFSDGDDDGVGTSSCRNPIDWAIANNRPYPYTVEYNSTNPRHSPVSLRVEMRGEDPTGDISPCNESSSGDANKHRFEWYYTSGTDSSRPNGSQEYWLGASFFIDSSWPSGNLSPPYTYIAQLFQHGGSGISEIGIKCGHNSNLQWQFMGTNGSANATLATISGFQRGRWHDMVFRNVRSTSSNGIIQIWRKIVGVETAYNQILNLTRVTALYGPDIGRSADYDFKSGLYWGNEIDAAKDCVAKYSGLRIALGSDGFDLVDPGLGGDVTPTFSIDAGGPYSGEAGAPVQLNSTVTPSG